MHSVEAIVNINRKAEVAAIREEVRAANCVRCSGTGVIAVRIFNDERQAVGTQTFECELCN